MGNLDTNAIEVRCHRGRDALRALAPQLAAGSLLPPPLFFMDPLYLAAGLESGDPCLLVAYRQRLPVAYMPFVIRPARMVFRLGPLTVGKLPYRQLRLFGYHSRVAGDHELLSALFGRLLAMRRQFDMVYAAELPRHDPLADFLRNGLQTVQREFAGECSFLDSYRVAIAGGFQDYLRTRWNTKTRSRILKTVRQLEEKAAGQLRFECYRSVDDVAPFLRRASQIAHRTYQWRRGYKTICDTPLFSQKLGHFARCGQLRSHVLFVRDVPVAYSYGIIHERRFLGDITGYDERFAEDSPGKVLFFKILEDLFSSGLVDELDFGAGPGEYKRLFSTANPGVLSARLYVRSPYPRLLAGLERYCKDLSAAAKPWVASLPTSPLGTFAAGWRRLVTRTTQGIERGQPEKSTEYAG